MFQQAPPTLCWSSQASPTTLVNIGTNAFGILCQNIIVFHDVKTKAMTYYKADNAETGAGISCLAGHQHFSVFAFAETILRPSIHVIQYPGMKSLVKIPPITSTGFLDIFLTENCYLIAITAGPEYRLHLWNYRTGVHCAQIDTQKCRNHCLYVRPSIEPSMIQYSAWSNELIAWEISLASDKYSFHNVATVKLDEKYKKSEYFAIAFAEDSYIVNDYGVVSSINFGNESFKAEWIATQQHCNEPKAWMLFSHKGGLLVVNNTSVYCIKKRQHEIVLEWHLNDSKIPISKLVSNIDNEIYASTLYGNIYNIDYNQDGVKLKEISTGHCDVQDFCLIGAFKEEMVLLLTMDGELRLVDLAHMNKLSSIYCDNAYCLESHNSLAYICVGTKSGKIHFISYLNYRDPIELAVLQTDEVSIKAVKVYDTIALVIDEMNGVSIVRCDYEAKNFTIAMSLERASKQQRYIVKVFLLDENRAVFFVSETGNIARRLADYLWLLSWQFDSLIVQRREFHLHFSYKDFTLIRPYSQDKIEIVAVRKDDLCLDEFVLEKGEFLCIKSSIRTSHLGYIGSISGSRDVLTSSIQDIVYHYKSHRLDSLPYSISRILLTTFASRLPRRTECCFRSKYLIVLYADGYLLIFRLTSISDSLKKNSQISSVCEVQKNFIDYQEEVTSQTIIRLPEVTQRDLDEQSEVIEELTAIRKAMQELIDFDISVTGHTQGIFRKFCLNTKWCSELVENARILFKRERAQLLEAISDKIRIKNWILELIRSSKNHFSYRIRSVFSNVYLESYGMHPIMNEVLERFDHFRFYDLDSYDNDLDLSDTDSSECSNGELEEDSSVLEHVMSKDFELQDTTIVTFNQMYNENAKLQVLLVNSLKQEFNKKFKIIKKLKQDFIKDILNTNTSLQSIYSNINCMLCLLNMDGLIPPMLTVPEYSKDESLNHILSVEDSEISVPNPHRELMLKTPPKTGRMLLWPINYWMRAIMFMMDGVLEKLWEEEIKKTPPPPEFTKNKQPSEYTIEEQRVVKEYEKKLTLLQDDRQKYLRILKERETKILSRKKSIISKLNKLISEMAVLKLNYDFAIKHEQIRLQNLKTNNFKRIQCKNRINKDKNRIDKDAEYMSRYTELIGCWEHTFADFKSKLENQTLRDKQIEKSFKSQYLSSVPAHLTFELNKIYKRRPKLSAKAFGNSSFCYEVADRLMSKKYQKFPLPAELQEFLVVLESLDDFQHCPHQLDHRHWESFAKIRRQKLESELRMKAIGYQLLDAQNCINFLTKESNTIKAAHAELSNSMTESIQEYFEITQNRTLELVLPLGQVEVNLQNFLTNYHSYMLLNVNDISEINDMIMRAGKKKIISMRRVAFFRRQVIYKEWEHKVVRANIEYLQHVLKLITNCKITYEFLELLRNWNKFEGKKKFISNAIVGSLEKETEQKIEIAAERLKLIEIKNERLRRELNAVSKSNTVLNRKITEFEVDINRLNLKRDVLREEKIARERNERFLKMKSHRNLINKVRRDYVQIMELTTILELQRLRTYPTLGPPPQHHQQD